MNIENIFEHYQHTIQAITAFATLLASCVALWLARLKSTPKLRIEVDWKDIFEGIDDFAVKTGGIVAIMIDNIGLLPVYITAYDFHWRLPFSFLHKKQAQQFPSDLNLNVCIYPGESKVIELDNDVSKLLNELSDLCN